MLRNTQLCVCFPCPPSVTRRVRLLFTPVGKILCMLIEDVDSLAMMDPNGYPFAQVKRPPVSHPTPPWEWGTLRVTSLVPHGPPGHRYAPLYMWPVIPSCAPCPVVLLFMLQCLLGGRYDWLIHSPCMLTKRVSILVEPTGGQHGHIVVGNQITALEACVWTIVLASLVERLTLGT